MSSEQEILTDKDRANGFSIVADDCHNMTLLKWGKPVAWFSAVVPGEVLRQFLELIKVCGGKKCARSGEKFTVSGDNKGLMCPFKSIICQEEGSCKACQIYLGWQKLGEILVICAWCGKEIDRKPALGHPGVSHGICPECKEKHFPGARSEMAKVHRIERGEK